MKKLEITAIYLSYRIIDQIKKHEGMRLSPYRDSVGKLTIGYGRNLDDKGIRLSEANLMLDNDINECIIQLKKNLPCFNNLDIPRQAVLINMCFNMGISGLLEFYNTLEAIEEGRYEEAAYHMLQSKWAKQVKNRAKELAEQMKTGKFPDE